MNLINIRQTLRKLRKKTIVVLVSDNYYSMDYYKVKTNATLKEIKTVEVVNAPPGRGRFNSTSITEMEEWMSEAGYVFKVIERLPKREKPDYMCLIGNY